MDMIFVRQGGYEKGDAAFPMIRKAVLCFAEENGTEPEAFDDLPAVRRTDKGRPYLDWPGHEGVDISVTHSGDIWMCLVSEGRCGIDLQILKDEAPEGAADRFFTEGECKYIEEDKPGTFFDIWVRREALGKYGGRGFFGKYPDSAPDGKLADRVCFTAEENGETETVYIHEITEDMLSEAGIEVKEGFRAAAAVLSEKAPVIRKIQAI